MVEKVFGSNKPFTQCSASTLAKLPDGRFLVACFGGTREGHDDVCVWAAYRDLDGWSKPFKLAKKCNEAHWNPVLFLDDKGRLFLFFKVGKSVPEWKSYRIFSDDFGESWSKPCQIEPGSVLARGPVKNKPAMLSNGSLIAGASFEGDKECSANSWKVFLDISNDSGASWVKSDFLDYCDGIVGAGAIQPTIWESAPGNVHMLLRSSSSRICRSDSTDYGQTWSPIYKTSLPNNNSGVDLAKLQDGTLVLVYNPIGEDWGLRNKIAFAVSKDNGNQWEGPYLIEALPDGEWKGPVGNEIPPEDALRPEEVVELSYPAIIPTGSGTVATCYTWNRKDIAFWQGSISEIRDLPVDV